jgi:hypothetical protein
LLRSLRYRSTRCLSFLRSYRKLTQVPASVVLTWLGCTALSASITSGFLFRSRAGHPERVLLIVGELALAFICFLAAARRCYPDWVTQALCALFVPLVLWSSAMAAQTLQMLGSGLIPAATTLPAQYDTDDMFYNHYNALLVLRGQNPYVGAHLADEVLYFRSYAEYTPIARGRFRDLHAPPSSELRSVVMLEYLEDYAHPPVEIDPRTEHSYPAGAFLIAVPFVWAGLPSIALPQILLFLGLGLVLVISTPSRWRLIVALLYLSTVPAAHQIMSVDFDIWPLSLIAGAWLLRERRVTSSLFLGAACAIKQTAWFAAPFYLIWTWRVYGVHAAIERTALAMAAFLAINLPWIVSSPGDWFASLWLPMSLPLFPGDDGLVNLAAVGVGPLLPSWGYGVLEVVVLSGALVWYWRMTRRFPFAGLSLAFLPLLLAWRSTERYFTLLPLAAVVALVLALRNGEVDGTVTSY